MSFFASVKSFFHKLFGSLPSWEKSASSTLAFAAPLVEEIVALSAGEPAAAEVQQIVAEIQKDMATVATVVSGAAGAPSATSYQTATTALNSIKANLGGLLTAGHVKNPETLAKVTGVANTIIGEVEAILSEIPAPAAAATPAPAAS